MKKFHIKATLTGHTNEFCNGWTKQDYFDEYLKIQMKQSTLSRSERIKVVEFVDKLKEKGE